MYGLMRRRSMMTMVLPVPTERLIYSLTDYTCDGTVNTFIDTGIKLFGIEYSAFRIEMEFDNLVYSSLATVLECKAFGQTYNNGLCFRCSSNNMQIANLYPVADDVYFSLNNNTLSVICNRSGIGSITGVNNHREFFGEPAHNEPLTIGGRYSSHLSNPDRFVQVHISSLKIYATPSDIDPTYINLPLTFKCITGGDLSIKNANGSYDRNFEYSLNGGAWTAFDLPKNTASKLIATLSPNDTISFRRDNDNFADAQFLSDSNLTFDIYGNLLSLQYGSAFSGQMDLRNTAKQAFGATFSGTNVVDASNLMLTAPTIFNTCYQRMFFACENLVYAPKILPANTVPQFAYQHMFNGCISLISTPKIYATTLTGRGSLGAMFCNCTSLVTAPELHITTLGTLESCTDMFKQCTSLTTAPELPATTLSDACYSHMFEGCTNLTTAPNLPATTLAKGCYYGMFRGCTSLTTASELPATTLVQECYYDLFKNCSRLNYIKCLATDISASFCRSGWVADISSTGTFVKASGVTWPSGNSGIPNGWTVIEE